MHPLQAGLLRTAALPCLTCGGVGGACWCAGTPRDPRHDEGALAGVRLARVGRAFA